MADGHPAEVVVLALGHPDRGDDQFGPALLSRFAASYAPPPELQLLQGGTRPLALYPRLIRCRWLILLDAVHTDQPGQGLFIRDPLPLPATSGRIAIHQVGIAELLELMQILGEQPQRLSLIGAPVQSLAPGAPLHHSLQSLLPAACTCLARLLRDGGLALAPLGVEDVAVMTPSTAAGDVNNA